MLYVYQIEDFDTNVAELNVFSSMNKAVAEAEAILKFRRGAESVSTINDAGSASIFGYDADENRIGHLVIHRLTVR